MTKLYPVIVTFLYKKYQDYEIQYYKRQSADFGLLQQDSTASIL
jgi:hypothetical protein